MPTAQETYRDMMKMRVAPGLRALGFKGSGQNYALPSHEYWALLSFQKSAYSDADEVRFTINVLVVSREAWEANRKPWNGKRPTATTFYGDFAWQHRIADFVPGDTDLWWTLGAGVDTAQLAETVLWAVEDFALPAMRGQMT